MQPPSTTAQTVSVATHPCNTWSPSPCVPQTTLSNPNHNINGILGTLLGGTINLFLFKISLQSLKCRHNAHL